VLVLLLAISRPQTPDYNSEVSIEGSDIMLALDISGSMQLFDDLHDRRSRFEVAQKEALRFIDKRPNDPIGLTYFAAMAFSRCPLTLDKTLLHDLVVQTNLGDVRADGTVISQALVVAINRLRSSQAASKIIILLTDGSPSQNDIPEDFALDLAKKYNIKIYTIAIGAEGGGFIEHPLHGIGQVPDSINESLLQKIAHETGGAFFRSQNPTDMRRVYDAIDALETTEYQTPIYTRYYEWFVPLLWLVVALVMGECMITAIARVLV
jgi:Ca-activated chloride channel family protein